MHKTLLLVFIHGFRGGNDTFMKFPEQLTALVRHALPDIAVQTVTYPKFETRGDLKECVARFREWLQNKVIDIEVANGTPSPTVDPSVHVVLVGHSMGGIVGAETLLLLASEQPIPSLSASQQNDHDDDGPSSSPPFFMFPHIQGLMAFDTPFLGIAPGVVSHGAQEHYKSASAAYNTFNEVAGLFGYGGNKAATSSATASTTASGTISSAATKPGTLPLPPVATDTAADAAATPSWSRWGKMAMFAGAAGAVAAGGAAALYSQRERFTEGWRWVTSHLEFVGSLARPGDLRNRVASLADIQHDLGIKAVNFYTCLGKGAPPAPAPAPSTDNKNPSSLFLRIPRARDRTFCHLPEDFDANDHHLSGDGTPDHPGIKWVLALNDKASDETTAHISMFGPKENPKYYMLAHEAADIIVRWIDRGWYASASRRGFTAGTDGAAESDATMTEGGDGDSGKAREDMDDFIVL